MDIKFDFFSVNNLLVIPRASNYDGGIIQLKDLGLPVATTHQKKPIKKQNNLQRIFNSGT